MLKFQVDSADRLDRFLTHHFPTESRTRVARHIESGAVLVNGKVEQKSGSPLKPGMVVECEPLEATVAHDLTPVSMDLDVVFEDESLLVVNKARGLATHPAVSLKEPSLVNALLARGQSLSQEGGAFRPGIVHRLDKETTGLILIAKNDFAHRHLARQIQNKTAERRYVAVAYGSFEHAKFRVDAPIVRSSADRRKMMVDPDGRSALTEFKLLKNLGNQSLLGAKLFTGRTHQIRVHLQSIGHPVMGDAVYAPSDAGVGPMQLHAAFLEFSHPLSGERIRLLQPPPPDFCPSMSVDLSQVADW